MKKNKGTLVISLDFELIWGVFDHIDPLSKLNYFENTRKLIPQLCQLFADNKIAVTWATVGMLMHENWEDWLAFQPKEKPNYANKSLNPYRFGLEHKDIVPESLFFAPDLVHKIQQTPFQEMATHSYSHYYCLEKGESLQAFDADLERAVAVAQRFNLPLKSLVFPRNQYTESHIQLCAKWGIESVRTNPNIWFWDNECTKSPLLKKVFRTGDAYMPIANMVYEKNQIKSNTGVILQPASRFYRPFGSSQTQRLLHRKRVFDEMTAAAKNNNIYHLWWHPHNFGNEPEICLQELKMLINHFIKLQEKYGMQSNTMGQIAATQKVFQ